MLALEPGASSEAEAPKGEPGEGEAEKPKKQRKARLKETGMVVSIFPLCEYCRDSKMALFGALTNSSLRTPKKCMAVHKMHLAFAIRMDIPCYSVRAWEVRRRT